MIIGGDWNARLGKLGAMEDGEVRQTKDELTNEDGEKWWDLLCTHGLSLCNGNTEGDYEGNFTRMGYKHQEESVLDYVAVSNSMMERVEMFEVGHQSHSDHFPLHVRMSSKITVKQEEIRTITAWDRDNKALYRSKLEKCAPGSSWKEIHHNFWSCTTKLTVGNRGPSRASWWNEECLTARKYMEQKLRKVRNGEAQPEEWRTAKRGYKNKNMEAKEQFEKSGEVKLLQVHSIGNAWKCVK